MLTAVPPPNASGRSSQPISPNAPTPKINAPLNIGSLSLWPPVIAAPMAGISCAPYRRLACEHGAAMAVSEMVIASTLLAGYRESAQLTKWADDESLRSVQLYGVQPDTVEQAVRLLIQDRGVHHIDLNFGCPVKKVTRKGGGAALPCRPRLLARIIGAAVRGAGNSGVPVTVKMRIGIDDKIQTYLEAGRVAEAEGAAALTLHARTAEQQYDPPAHWDAIAALVEAVQVPVVGNGDIFDGADALRMMQQTGCAGVMVGRAALGRPWVFSSLRDAFERRPAAQEPCLGHVLRVATRHLTDMIQHYTGYEEERFTVVKLRKLVPLYLLGFTTSNALLARLLAALSLEKWHAALAVRDYDPNEPFPACAAHAMRLKGGQPAHATQGASSSIVGAGGVDRSPGLAGAVNGGVSRALNGSKGGGRKKVVLPDGWLAGRWDDAVPSGLDDDACEG